MIMETKYITIPFDLERAKRISSGEEEGKIVTRVGRNVRIVCWDRKDIDCIVALIETEDGVEHLVGCNSKGDYVSSSESEYDLLLSVPERTTFKDGDVLYAKTRNFWFIFIYKNNGIDKTRFYAALENQIVLWLEENSATVNNDIHELRLATETEKQMLIDELKASNDPRAKEHLKRFFPNHSNSENIGKQYNFEPFDKVLVRDDNTIWQASFFSHCNEESDNKFITTAALNWKYCLPYNEQTKHLLGTTKDWEE